MLVLIQEALNAGAGLGFPLTRMIAHAEAAVDDRKSGFEWVEYERAPELRRRGDLHLRRQSADGAACRRYSSHASELIIGGVLVENSFFTRPHDFIREVQSRTGPTQSYRGRPAEPQIHVRSERPSALLTIFNDTIARLMNAPSHSGRAMHAMMIMVRLDERGPTTHWAAMAIHVARMAAERRDRRDVHHAPAPLLIAH